MGRGSDYYDDLRSRYASERVLFVPFIRPPHHLQVTRLASIGVLSYFPDPSSLAAVINPLYCAPNKIFEYARYGVPMYITAWAHPAARPPAPTTRHPGP